MSASEARSASRRARNKHYLCCICFRNGAEAAVRPTPTTPIRVPAVLRALWGGPSGGPRAGSASRPLCLARPPFSAAAVSDTRTAPPPETGARYGVCRPSIGPGGPSARSRRRAAGCLPSSERAGRRRGRRAATPKQSSELLLFPQTNTQRYITTHRLPRSDFIFPASSELRDEPARRRRSSDGEPRQR